MRALILTLILCLGAHAPLLAQRAAPVKPRSTPSPSQPTIEIGASDLVDRFAEETRALRLKLRERALELDDVTTETLDTTEYAQLTIALLDDVREASYRSGWRLCEDVVIPPIRPATEKAYTALAEQVRKEMERRAEEARRLREEQRQQAALKLQIEQTEEAARQSEYMKKQVEQKEAELKKLDRQNDILAEQLELEKRRPIYYPQNIYIRY